MTQVQYQTKHLSVVESTANDAYSTIESTYGLAKDKALHYTPGFVGQMVSTIEKYCSPVVSFSQKTASKILLYADSTVDTSLSYGTSIGKSARQQASHYVGEERLKPVDSTISYVQTCLHDSVETIKDKGVIGASKVGVQQAWAGVQNAGSYAKSTVLQVNHHVGDYASAFKQKADAITKSVYEDFLTPTVNKAAAYLGSARKSIVKQPLYATLYNYTTKGYSYVSGLTIVKMPLHYSHEYLYPIVKPVAGPFVEKSQPYIKNIKKDLKPEADPVPVVDVVMKKAENGKSAAKSRAKSAKKQTEEKADAAASQLQDASGGSYRLT